MQRQGRKYRLRQIQSQIAEKASIKGPREFCDLHSRRRCTGRHTSSCARVALLHDKTGIKEIDNQTTGRALILPPGPLLVIWLSPSSQRKYKTLGSLYFTATAEASSAT